jgi:hypothetical protein
MVPTPLKDRLVVVTVVPATGEEIVKFEIGVIPVPAPPLFHTTFGKVQVVLVLDPVIAMSCGVSPAIKLRVEVPLQPLFISIVVPE